LILGISGGIRLWRDWEFYTVAKKHEVCPIRLADLPRQLGTWRSIAENDSKLDPEIARIAGSKDHLIRKYQDEKSGEEVCVLVLFGPADSVFGHLPEVCYPSVGYRQNGPAQDHQLTVPGWRPARFRVAYFNKKSGPRLHEVEVCHTFLHKNEWLPSVADRWKTFRLYPAMFKIQIERVAGRQSFEFSSPAESILSEFVAQINQRLAEKEGPAKNAAAPAIAATTQK
jgi:hypothetical protein